MYVNNKTFPVLREIVVVTFARITAVLHFKTLAKMLETIFVSVYYLTVLKTSKGK